ncbi:hypothetical protein [Novosphingobium sp. 9]|uniref:hypothetical protein n=1 Tax=Novosphingobium sp. 9 TaxID=2025349 RepID=UPI0021B65624|nr:hypothetical protein [Novosphingobium sp. 9]
MTCQTPSPIRRILAASALTLSLTASLTAPAIAQTVATSRFTPADVQPPTIPGVPRQAASRCTTPRRPAS